MFMRTMAGLSEPLIVADLIFDSWREAGPAGHRGVAGDGRQLAFSTQVVDIALTLLSRPNRTISVAGQLFPADGFEDRFGVELVGDPLKIGEIHESTQVDDLGEFWLEGLPPGAYHLVITTPNMGILVTPVELTELAA